MGGFQKEMQLLIYSNMYVHTIETLGVCEEMVFETNIFSYRTH